MSQAAKTFSPNKILITIIIANTLYCLVVMVPGIIAFLINHWLLVPTILLVPVFGINLTYAIMLRYFFKNFGVKLEAQKLKSILLKSKMFLWTPYAIYNISLLAICYTEANHRYLQWGSGDFNQILGASILCAVIMNKYSIIFAFRRYLSKARQAYQSNVSIHTQLPLEEK